MKIGHSQSTRRQRIDVRRPVQLAAKAAKIPVAKVVGHYVNDIGRLLRPGWRLAKRHQKQTNCKNAQSHFGL
jgi:hypothetical protein